MLPIGHNFTSFFVPFIVIVASHCYSVTTLGTQPLSQERAKNAGKREQPFERLEQKLLETLPGKKSIFRSQLTNSGEAAREEEFIDDMAKKMQQEMVEQSEEVNFFEEKERFSSASKRESSQSQFEETRFDPQFPVHNLCGPWNSGNQASNLEWAEPADKLLKLLRTTVGTKKYNLFMAPGQMTGHTTNVSIAIYIESMSSFKAQTMDFEVDMYFAMGWYDRRLAHNCTHPLLITHKQIAERIWTPDLYFLNAKFAYLQEVTTPNFMLIVYPDGLVFKTLRIDVTLSCNMDLQMFPFDKQECPMVIQSFAYIESMLNLSWHVDPPFYPIATNPELKLNDMAITGMRFEQRCSSPYTMFRGTGVWSCIRGYIVMKRLVLFHLIQTYIPSAMLVSISWMTFWLDPRASPARISLTITSLLTLTTMTNGARQDLPQVSYIKAMDIWQTFSQALIFLVLLEYSFVSYYFTKRTFHCRHRKKMKKKKKQRRNGQKHQQIYTNTVDDVRLAHLASNAAKGFVNNDNNGSTAHEHPGTTVNSVQGMSGTGRLCRRRWHSAATADSLPFYRTLTRQHSQQNTPSAIQATVPPHSASKPVPLSAAKNFLKQRHRLCTEVSDFEMAGIVAPEMELNEVKEDGSRRGERGEGPETATTDEENEEDWVDRPCQRCQCLDQRTARAIDRYSRLLFPVIFTAFCTSYWLYYWHVMAEH